MDIATRATTLLDLHHTGTTLVLPNVWDAWSATVVAEAGFPALSIGSHPLADSRGQGDNEDMTIDDALDGIRRICSAVPETPVTADMESGYGVAAAELVERLLEAGAVGLNIEDTVHSEGGRLREVAEHADYIGAIRQAADSAGVDLVVNARTDAFIKKGVFDDPVAEAITRMQACEAAGSRCSYPVGAPDAAAVQALLDALDGPVNVIANPRQGSAAGSLDDLRTLGVHRVTFGPLLMKELAPDLAALVAPWK
ncbi:isocitrate lyase/phosphoenolpyruvate mutase family protein [Nocardioides oleivorans]|uniref:Isocitrate lyase/phosphoenolpyruvate mutase family protein n=1 Tax=Nocardioides oleivorans TaxID=273676 RepID=A0A4Q2S0N7_9ACTN|nr:isocitrate lyase/phosphoenolpyruvate mutase family protein [Nocardioides oleivorans]RYB95018.1 isocitrate lyase/phosphoenolpyruvate mutase family protein [Nocardioides oleivorans]